MVVLLVVVVGVLLLDGLSQRHKFEGRIGEVLSIVVVVVVVIMMMIIIMDDTHTQVSSSIEADRSGGEGGEREKERKREMMRMIKIGRAHV